MHKTEKLNRTRRDFRGSFNQFPTVRTGSGEYQTNSAANLRLQLSIGLQKVEYPLIFYQPANIKEVSRREMVAAADLRFIAARGLC